MSYLTSQEKSIRSTLTVIVLSAVLLSPSVVVAQGHDKHNNDVSFSGSERGAGMMKHMLKRMMHKLDLNQEQRDEIRLIAQQAKTDNSELKSVMMEFKGKSKALMVEQQFDEQAFISLHQEYQDSLAEVALARAKTRHAILSILTAEQRAKWLSMKHQKGG